MASVAVLSLPFDHPPMSSHEEKLGRSCSSRSLLLLLFLSVSSASTSIWTRLRELFLPSFCHQFEGRQPREKSFFLTIFRFSQASSVFLKRQLVFLLLSCSQSSVSPFSLWLLIPVLLLLVLSSPAVEPTWDSGGVCSSRVYVQTRSVWRGLLCSLYCLLDVSIWAGVKPGFV